MKVGDGVIIDGSKLGLNGGLLTGVVDCISPHGWYIVRLPREVERWMLVGAGSMLWSGFVSVMPKSITATIPNQGHWLGKEMP